MRLFFAIALSDEARQAAAEAQSALRQRLGAEGVQRERPEKLHLTVHVLGETAESQLGHVIEAGRQAAAACPAFLMQLGGLGAFPNRRAPRVLWLGARQGGEEYLRLTEGVERSLEERPAREKRGEQSSDRRYSAICGFGPPRQRRPVRAGG